MTFSCPDHERAQKFYSELFGWTVNADPSMGGYGLVDTGAGESAVGGPRRLYRARPEGLAELREFLDDMWSGALDNARRIAEAEYGTVDNESEQTA